MAGMFGLVTTIGGFYWQLRHEMKPGEGLACQMILPLQVVLSYCDILHGHAIAVSEQLLESGKADSEADHLGSEGMPQLMRPDRSGAAGAPSRIDERLPHPLITEAAA